MKIFITRHGQTNYNLTGLCSDLPTDNVYLTDLGIRQANIIANKLENTKIDAIYISEFPRTKQTAEIINKFHNLPLIVDNKLNENKTGFNGKPTKEYLNGITKQKNFWHVRLNNGESFHDVQKRIYLFIDNLKEKKYNNVLIIAHSSTIKFFCGYFNKLSNDEIFNYRNIENCEILEFNV